MTKRASIHWERHPTGIIRVHEAAGDATPDGDLCEQRAPFDWRAVLAPHPMLYEIKAVTDPIDEDGWNAIGRALRGQGLTHVLREVRGRLKLIDLMRERYR